MLSPSHLVNDAKLRKGKKMLKKLFGSKRAQAINYGLFVGLAIAIVIAVSLVPTIVETINGTDTSEWSDDFTGGSGASALFQLILLVFIAGIIIWRIKYVLG